MMPVSEPMEDDDRTPVAARTDASPVPSQTPEDGPPSALSLLRSRSYITILVVAALVGAPVALVSYWFLQLSTHLQDWTFVALPEALGLGAPTWWPVPVLVVGGGVPHGSWRPHAG
jgi:hypothetical protein